MAIGAGGRLALQDAKIAVQQRVLGAAQQYRLPAPRQGVEEGVADQFHPLLGIQPTDHSQQGLGVLGQPEALAQGLLAAGLGRQAVRAEGLGDAGVRQGIPDRDVDAIEDAGKAVRPGAQRGLEPQSLLGGQDLPGVTGGDSGDVVAMDDAPLQQIDQSGIGGVPQPLRGQQAPRIQSHLAQDLLPHPALVAQVVQGVADPGPLQAPGPIYLVKQYRHQAGVPVMAVDDIGPATGMGEKLQHRHGEAGETFRIVRLAVDDPAPKEVLRRPGIDEPARDAVQSPLIEVTRQGRGEIGQAQFQGGLFQPVHGL